MKILIAEDDLPSRLILEGVLIKWGYDVVAVSNGSDAIDRLLDADAPKLVLHDWMKPDKDGIEVCHMVRQKETTPSYIILLTGKGNKTDITKGLESGADDYIVKPYDIGELQARINGGQRMIGLQNVLTEKEKLNGVIEMAGAVCHEMNQPLQVISGLSELLLMDVTQNNPLYKNIQGIKDQIDRMGGITKKLMNITRYETKDYLKGSIVDIDKSSKI